MSTPYRAQKKVSPIPVLSIYIGAVDQLPLSGPFDAIVDTGADLTLFPISILHRVQARSTGDGQLRTPFGDLHTITFFVIDLRVEGISLPGVVVAGDKSVSEIMLGRNVLNKIVVLLDGPEKETQILNDAEKKRLRVRR